MTNFNFVFILIVAGLSFSTAETNSSENEKPTVSTESSKSDPQPMSKTSKNVELEQTPPEYLIIPKPKMEARIFKPQFLEYLDKGELGFTDNQRQRVYLSDNTGQYDVNLQNFQREQPSKFQAALGAISAHILNQRTDQEYVPYPPNGNPYNYPAYRGHPRATEPPAIRAYERASKSNYNVRPVDVDQPNLKRIFPSVDYTGFAPQFQNSNPGFYNNPNFFVDRPLYDEIKNIEPHVWYKDQSETFRRSAAN